MSENTPRGVIGAALWALALGASALPMGPVARAPRNERTAKPPKKKRKFKGSRQAKRSSRP